MKALRGSAVALVLGLAVVSVCAAGEEATNATATESCCFNNPRFTGTCKVTPAEDETCASILSYLNNPNSVGRAYCGNTKIRGGWTQVACEDTATTSTSATTVCQAPEPTP
jgi:hypothetical protein